MVYWAIQMSWLVDAYLGYRSWDSRDGFPFLNNTKPPLQLPLETVNNIELVDLFDKL